MKKNKEGTQVAKHKDKKSFKARLSSIIMCACYNLVGSVCACAGRNAFVHEFYDEGTAWKNRV